MSEIRKHNFLDEYVIISPRRRERPHGDSQGCPFCPGNEHITPPGLAYLADGRLFQEDKDTRASSWNYRCIPNLFPALTPNPQTPVRGALPGQGFHEVIVETPHHDRHPASLTKAELNRLLEVYQDRYEYYSHLNQIKYVALFRNHKPEAGASLPHPHTQIISLPLIPPLIARELKSDCPYCKLSEAEERKIKENHYWTAFTPFASKVPYETWILPQRHTPDLTDLTKSELTSLAEILEHILKKIAEKLEDPPYNLLFFQHQNYHLNIRILPKLSKIAGFELETGIYINTVTPEDAAKMLR